MANDYAPKQFLRQAENGLLEQYFAQRKEQVDVPWDELPETDSDTIYEAWQQLPEASVIGIDEDFRNIAQLASGEGIRTLIEEGHFHKVELAPSLDARDGFVNKAFWVFLNQRRVFDVALILDRSDHLNGRYWRMRKDMPKKAPDLSPDAIDELARSLSAYYREKQGRGRHCHVDKYLRADRKHYFFAYPQDYADTFIGYDDKGAFERKRQNPAFEVIFVYDPIDGELDLFAQGGKDIKQDLQEVFARTILHEDLGQEDKTSQPYELNGLKKRDFAFPTDPADRIAEVRVKALRLSVIGNGGRQLSFEVPPKGPTREIHDFIENALDAEQLPMAMVNVKSAAIQVRFDTSGGPGRQTKTVSFRVSHPDSCNLKDSPEELLVKQYLKRWEIERA